MQAYKVAIIQDHLSSMDAYIKAFEVRVHQSLSMVRPADLTTIHTEIQQLWTDMTTTLVALVTLPKTILPVPVVDLFALE